MAKVPIEYFTPEEPGSFSGIRRFQRHHPNYSLKDLGNILSEYRSYTLHKPARKTFPRNKTIVDGIDAQWDVDMSDLTKYAKFNDGYKFLMCVICVFSKMAWVIPTTSKTAPEILSAWKKLFEKTTRRPRAVRSDKGGEFQNKMMKKFFEDHHINYFITQNETVKASNVERFQRTLKAKMWRFFTYNRTYRYIDDLDKLVSSYNRTNHRSLNTYPANVGYHNEEIIRERLYGYPQIKKMKHKYNVGDHVRVVKTRTPFQKSYEGLWSEEVFVIDKQVIRQLPVYRLKDLNGKTIMGTWYEYELQKIKYSDDIFIIEKVIRERRRKGKKEYFVKWSGWPSSFNSWVDEIL